MNRSHDSKPKSIGALWRKSSAKCPEFFTGNLEITDELRAMLNNGDKVSIVAWKNKEKKTDNHPDFRIHINDWKPHSDPRRDRQPVRDPSEGKPAEDELDSSEIPF